MSNRRLGPAPLPRAFGLAAAVLVGAVAACGPAAPGPGGVAPTNAGDGAAGAHAASGGGPDATGETTGAGVPAADGAPSAGGEDVGSPNDAATHPDATGAPDAADGGDSATSPDGAGAASACPTTLVGWATVDGDGVAATTGGGAGAPVRPATAAELVAYAGDATPRVIELSGTFTVPRLQVASNKTLVGAGTDAKLVGGLRIRGTASAPVHNVIVRNLHIDGATTTADGDAAQIYYAHHVWIDHCEIWDGPDGNLDMTHAVNWVTVSWTKFRYTAAYEPVPGETADHRFSSLVGHSDDNGDEDSARLKITFHHDWWAEGVLERMPRVRFGQVHVFNNYFASAGNNYCVRAGAGARLLVEGNHFDGVKSPHEFNSPADEATASITARDNLYSGTTGLQATGGGGTPLTSVPYAVVVETTAGLAGVVRACAGPR